ncbi:MAG: TIGR00730 family Rossman fold protein [Bacteroidota bacterium]
MKSIAVYCGSSKGDEGIFSEYAKQLAQELYKNNLGLVYGGGNVGLMGVIADEMLRLGGEVIGVIPKQLFEYEVGHKGITELIVVGNMHERKMKIFELCDACIAMPGGVGTMEEIFEAFTWTQLGFHRKPVGVLNVNGFYNLLDDLLNNMVQHKFLKQEHKSVLLFDENPESLVDRIINYKFEYKDKWL